ncbi:MAG: Cna B-type domain-containing protein [Clostridia bacterium]|nr:Cna B-type domain-containing protein [Clostridia bacterium]
MKKGKRNGKIKSVVALLLCLAQLLPCFAMAEGIASDRHMTSAKVLSADDYAATSDVLKAVKWDLYKQDGTIREYVPQNQQPSLAQSVEDMGELAEKTAKATKDVFFENAADAQQGIVKVVLDMAAGPVKPAPIDVVFILDRSGSMNQYHYTSDKTDQWTVPCMNPYHYYQFGSTKVATTRLDGEVVVPGATLVEFGTSGGGYNSLTWMSGVNAQLSASYGIGDMITNHYDKNGTKIAAPDHPTSGYTAEQHHTYYSPVYNINGDDNQCIDRSILARAGILEFVESVYEKNPDSRVAFTSFDANALDEHKIELVNKAGWESGNCSQKILSDRTGGQSTAYSPGVKAAIDFLKTPSDGRERYVVLISDGFPDHDNYEALETAMQEIKKEAEVYAVGMAVNIDTIADSDPLAKLRRSLRDLVPSKAANYENCKTNDEFNAFMAQIRGEILSVSAELSDTAGADFTLYADNAHKITLQVGTGAPVEYSSFADVPGAVVEGKKVTFTTNSLSEAGVRLSFYEKIDPSKIAADTAVSNLSGYPTNQTAGLIYKVDGETKTNQTITNHPSIRVSTATLTVSKSNNPTESILVSPQDTIEYTFTAQADGDFGFDNVVVKDAAPDGATGSAYTSTKVNVAAGETVTLEPVYPVTVLPDDPAKTTDDVIVNSAAFTTSTVPDTTAQTNEVKNRRAGEVTAQIEITKTLSGRTLKDGEFSFTLTGNGGTLTAQNDAEGKVVFADSEDTDVFVYSVAGDYVYTITEDNAALPEGVTGDTSTITATVHVLKNEQTGELYLAEPAVTFENEDSTFENTYDAKASLQIGGKKTLTGKAMEAGEFTFELTGEGVQLEAANAADGSFTFDVIDYIVNSSQQQTGTFTYEITEKAGSNAAIDYDETKYRLTVVVTDNENGTLKAIVTKVEKDSGTGYGAVAENEAGLDLENLKNTITFKNVYASEGKAQVEAYKELSGRTLKAGEFTFKLYPAVEATAASVDAADVTAANPLEATNDADGRVVFDEISYNETYAGQELWYVLEEEAGSLGGVTYDTKKYLVRITMTDDGQGKLTQKVEYFNEDGSALDAAPVFRNTYEAGPVQIALGGTKKLTGRQLEAGEFTFVLSGNGVEQEVKNDENGRFTFAAIEYVVNSSVQQTGTYTYEITEKAGANPAVQYDAAKYRVTVVVTDNEDGTLQAIATRLEKDEGKGEGYKAIAENAAGLDIANLANLLVFSNTYEAEGMAQVQARKELTGRALKEGEFTFKLYPAQTVEIRSTSVDAKDVTAENPLEATNDADGNVVFDQVRYDETYAGAENWYVLEEVLGTLGGVAYDGAKYRVRITMTDDGQGKLTQKVEYFTENGEPLDTVPVFANTYTASGELKLEGTKELSGRAFKNGDAYTFEISGSEGAPMPENTTVTITPASGTTAPIDFGTIRFTEADAGKTYTYTLTEKQSTIPGVAADAVSKTVEVSVEDDGEGKLLISCNYQADGNEVADIVFRNVYSAAGELPLELTKVIKNREFKPGDSFTFTIRAKDDGPLPVKDGETISKVTVTPKSGESVTVDFGAFQFTEADGGKIYSYEVVEVDEGARRIIYDTEPRTFTIEVKDDGEGNLTITPVYPEGGLVFTNEYIPPIDITVRKEWKTHGYGVPNKKIEVKLIRLDQPEFSMTCTLSKENDWTYTFYDLDSNHEYMVEEVTQIENFVTTIEKESETSFVIINQIRPGLLIPDTGDHSSLALWIGLALASLAGALLMGKRRRNE